MFGVDPISRSAEMGVVRFMGVTPLECNKSVPTLQNKNLKEHYICCVEHKICTIGISFCNKVTKIAIFRLSSHLKFLWKGVDKLTRLSAINECENGGLRRLEIVFIFPRLVLQILFQIQFGLSYQCEIYHRHK